MRDLCSVDFKDSVRFVVRRDLKRLGIKVPKYRVATKGGEYNKEGAVFGAPLEKVPSKNVGENYYCSVPKFLVDSASFLRQHLNTEGLFRKSGSVQRQKILKEKIELGGEIGAAQPHDVAVLMKQFFRQLQDPLLTNTFHDSFIKALRLEDEKNRAKAMLYICLMLPLAHLQALKYTMQFIHEFARHSEESKMGISNLAIVLTPNLMHNTRKDNSSASEKLLKDQTVVIKTLLKNAEYIGMVPGEIYERAKMIGDEGINGMVSSGDELDGEDTQTTKNKRAPRPRTRTGSITGFISKFKGSSTSSKTPVRQHRRSKSVKADLMRNKNKYNFAEDIIISKDDTELDKMVSRTQDRMSLRIYNKRKLVEPNSNLLSPANKRYQTRHMMKSSDGDSGIGQPVIVSRSTQMFATSMKPLTPVRPLAEMVKKEHAKTLLSAETEHVKVVDATTYIPSPDPSTITATSTFYAPSPRHTASGKPSPYDNVFESPVQCASEHDDAGDRGMQRRKVTRRNDSGATSCFSSSPRSRQADGNTKVKSIQEIGRKLANHPSEIENSHPSPQTPTPHPRKRSAQVHGSSVVKTRYVSSTSSRVHSSDTLTPCKYHVGTPPSATGSKEFKTVLTQKI